MRWVTYWEGPRPPLIDACLESLVRWLPGLEIWSDDLVAAAPGGAALLAEAAELLPALRSDLVRWWLLAEAPGAWVDADTIATGPVEFPGLTPEHEMFYVRWVAERRPGAAVATPVGLLSPRAANLALARCRELLVRQRAGEAVRYGTTSRGVVDRVAAELPPGRALAYEHWRYCPVGWRDARRAFLRASPWAWRPNARLWHLTNAAWRPRSGASREELLAGRDLLGRLLRWSEAKPRGRAAAILARLPAGPVAGVEVGVFLGATARVLLANRRDLRLWLVDNWGPSTRASYAATRDFQARFTPARWRAAWTSFQSAVGEPYAARATPLRGDSTAPEILAAVADRSMEFVFVDADHSYEAVAADLAAWWPKVRSGGWLGGHDYNHHREGALYGVRRAVDEFAALRGLPVEQDVDYTWFIRKP